MIFPTQARTTAAAVPGGEILGTTRIGGAMAASTATIHAGPKRSESISALDDAIAQMSTRTVGDAVHAVAILQVGDGFQAFELRERGVSISPPWSGPDAFKRTPFDSPLDLERATWAIDDMYVSNPALKAIVDGASVKRY